MERPEPSDIHCRPNDAIVGKTYIYGYLIATVTDAKLDPVHFEFEQVEETDVPEAEQVCA